MNDHWCSSHSCAYVPTIFVTAWDERCEQLYLLHMFSICWFCSSSRLYTNLWLQDALVFECAPQPAVNLILTVSSSSVNPSQRSWNSLSKFIYHVHKSFASYNTSSAFLLWKMGCWQPAALTFFNLPYHSLLSLACVLMDWLHCAVHVVLLCSACIIHLAALP